MHRGRLKRKPIAIDMHRFTSEAVSQGHPDKIADQIADAVLDFCLKEDPYSAVACEVFVTTGLVLVGGELSTEAYVDIREVVKQTLKDIGYTKQEYGFCADSIAILSAIQRQSKDIAQGVFEDRRRIKGAGDQGIMVGFACDETEALMPAPIFYAQRIMQRSDQLRHNNKSFGIRPDAKCQLSFNYVDQKPESLAAVVMSQQHDPDINHRDLESWCRESVMDPVIASYIRPDTKFYINPSKKFVIGGPQGDTGITGRKLNVDTYGGMARIGGGALSGKDCSKVDRSGAYMARYIAKHIVAAGIARRCEVHLGYAIGVAAPVSCHVDTFGTSLNDGDDVLLSSLVLKLFSCDPESIAERFSLRTPFFYRTSTYGHFGNSEFPWEVIDPSLCSSLQEAMQA